MKARDFGTDRGHPACPAHVPCELDPDLTESDCQLTECVMHETILLGRFVAFDMHE